MDQPLSMVPWIIKSLPAALTVNSPPLLYKLTLCRVTLLCVFKSLCFR